jgi:transposase
MDTIVRRGCGLDVHKDSVVACVRLVESTAASRDAIGQDTARQDTARKEVRTFGTTTGELLKLSDWLSGHQVTQVAMESTGVYWKPIWNVLEPSFQLLLVNARHIKMVPGRKTDVKDCEWIAELLQHGLLRASFVPNRSERELRELVRYRTTLVRERASEVNRIQKTLEGANIKLGSVASDVLGKSGREMLECLVGGSTDARAMAELAKGRLRRKIPELEQALRGVVAEHQRLLLAEQLSHIDYLDESIERLSVEVAARVRPFEQAIARLDGIPGINRLLAEALIAEIGIDMTRFPTAGHLASWAGMSPGNNESAGKRLSGKTRKGSKWLRSVLVEAALAAARKHDSYLAAQFSRLARRRGKQKAAIAVGHSILVIVYHLLKGDAVFQELGHNYFEERDREATKQNLIGRLERLGYKVKVEEPESVPAAA